jgi:ribosomal-protein-alanine N-acetyltransferase
MVIRGPRLTLRYARADDADALFELGSDPDISQFFSWGPYTDREQAVEFIERMATQREIGERIEFVITDENDQPIGITGLSEFAPRDGRAVVGTWLGKQHWGTGANAESKGLVLHLGFEILGLQRISAYAHPDNERSLRALERMGFTREGILVAWHLHQNERRDVAILRLLREVWQGTDLARLSIQVNGRPPTRISAGNLGSS